MKAYVIGLIALLLLLHGCVTLGQGDTGTVASDGTTTTTSAPPSTTDEFTTATTTEGSATILAPTKGEETTTAAPSYEETSSNELSATEGTTTASPPKEMLTTPAPPAEEAAPPAEETTATTAAPQIEGTITEAPVIEVTTTTTDAPVIEETTTTTVAPPVQETTTPAPVKGDTATTTATTTTTLGPLATPSDVTLAAAPGDITTGSIETVGTTIPANGDRNPIGLAVIPETKGRLAKGNLLLSNFNNQSDIMGTGSTILQFASTGTSTLFARIDNAALGNNACPGGIGLTGALGVLRKGWVIVGSLPSTDGTAATARSGCLIVLDADGRVVTTFSGLNINGPWGLAVADMGHRAYVFISNVLNGITSVETDVVNMGNIVRLELDVPEYVSGSMSFPRIISRRVIGSGFGTKVDQKAFIVGPTGMLVGTDNTTLYIADSLYNRIAAIPNAIFRQEDGLAGLDVTANGWLNRPLGMTRNLNGNILTTNGGDGRLVETSPSGTQVHDRLLLPSNGEGALFGVAANGRRLFFVDKTDNTLKRLQI